MNKKLMTLGTTITALATAGAITLPVFAATDTASETVPETAITEGQTDSAETETTVEDKTGYSFNTGKASYAAIMEEYGYSEGDDSDTNTSFSYYTGKQKQSELQTAYADLPENATEEEKAAFYASHDVGEGAAYVDGAYDESLKTSYSFNSGLAKYQ